ncbi:hypothetical protein CDES_08670 [Corynebacterium deserti GIMN1.010]|uniref:Bacterial transcription activator effector binding domain-containing protein n=1 Tax=Corynebacterium deserti GIMN1.010 TaxID=931089 RepID=A0A0M4CJV2_9CORY|nr:hypothetical protein [Corynebacterium deserti]ALC06126.1 hypothetical protein CDES_08670 [Corynebacterium deserti GIMN1.010]
MIVDTQFEKIPAHDVVGIRVILSSEDLSELFKRGYAEVKKFLRVEGIEPAGPARAYYFGDVSDTVDILIGFPVTEAQADKLRRGALSQSGGDIDDVVLHHFRDMKIMHGRHSGPFESVEQVWDEICDEVYDHGCVVPTNTICWEEFVDGQATADACEQLATEVYMQVCQVPVKAS